MRGRGGGRVRVLSGMHSNAVSDKSTGNPRPGVAAEGNPAVDLCNRKHQLGPDRGLVGRGLIALQNGLELVSGTRNLSKLLLIRLR